MIKLLRKQVKLFSTTREKMEYDVVIVGGGPAGLSTAIKLKQLEQKYDKPISVCLIEKGSYIGAHVISGNCFQPTAFNELFPNWKDMPLDEQPPLQTQVTQDKFMFLRENSAYQVPQFLLPKNLHNDGNYLISLSELCKWMGKQAEELGVEIYTGFSGCQMIFEDNQVRGVTTGEFGIDKNGNQKDTYQEGIDLIGQQTVLAEGCRGSLSESIIQKYNLRQGKAPQSYGLGLKEIWQIDSKKHQEGLVQHSVGWPLDKSTYGGSFLYHLSDNLVHLGMIVGLDYKNPYINPYEELQRFKTHNAIKDTLQGGQCISYGARALNEGSYFSIPKLTFPGGMLTGCSAGFLSLTKIKGTHNAMKSGIVAADNIFEKLDQKEITSYEEELKKSWVYQELYEERNLKKVFKKSMYAGFIYAGLSGHILKGKEPWNLINYKKDSECTEKISQHKEIKYPKHDNILTFDLLSNHQKSGTDHDHDQPAHLKVKEKQKDYPLKSLNEYGGIEEKFCPAKVYEFVKTEDNQTKLQINAQNCLHCKACSIKMVGEYINWTVPEGNGGPNYTGM